MAAAPFGEGFGVALSVQDRFSQPLAKFATSIARSRAASQALTAGLKSSAMRMGIFAIGIAGAGYAFSKAMKPGIEFERQMREVSAVTGAAGKEFVKMTNLAKKLGIETVFSAKEASGAMYMLGSRGISTAKDMEMLLQPSMDLAAALKFDLPAATELTMATLKMFGMELSQSREVVDLLTNAYKNSAANAEKLATSMQYVGPAFSSVNWELRQALPPLEMLYDLGINASMAGTALRKSINALIKPTREGATALRDMGLSVEQVSPELHSFTNIVRTLGEAGLTNADAITIFGQRAGPVMAKLVAEGADALLEYEKQLLATGEGSDKARKLLATYTAEVTASGAVSEFATALLQSYRLAVVDSGYGSETAKTLLQDFKEEVEATGTTSDAAGQLLRDYEEALKNSGSAAMTAAEQLKGLPGALVLIKSSIESVFIALEELFAPALEESVKWVTEGINAFLLWLQASEKMKWGIQDFIKAYSSMVRDWLKPSIVYIRDVVTNVMAAVGTWNKFSESQKAFVIAGAKTGLVLTMLVSAIAILGPAVVGLGKALLILNTPMLSVLAVVAALGIGVALLWAAWESNWGNIQEKVEEVWEAIKAKDWKALANIIVMPTLKWIGKQFATLADWAREALGLPEDVEKGIWEWTAITTTIPFLAKLVWEGIVNVVGPIKDWIIENLKIEKIEQLIVKAADFLIELPEPTKWFFKIGTRIWEYAALGYGIWWVAKSLLAAVKFAPIALPALLPILIGIGLALVGLDVLGSKLREKLDEANIEELLTQFSKEYPLLFKLSVAIREITGLEADLILAYIDEEWPSIAEKVGLTLLQIQIPLKIVFDIDIKSMVDAATEAIKAKFPTLIEQLGLLLFQIIIPLKVGFDIEFEGIRDKIRDFLLLPTRIWREEKPKIEEVAKEMAITIDSVADLIDTDALFIAMIAMTERGVEGYELGVGEFSKQSNIDRWNKHFETLDRETLKGQIAAASISIEHYWKVYKKKYGLEGDLALKDAGEDTRESFIKHMGPGYAPTKNVGEWTASLNKNWIPNMIQWMNDLGPLMEKWGANTLGEFVEGLEKAAPSLLTTTEKALLKVLKPMVTESPGYYPYGQWGMNTAEEFSDGVIAGLGANEVEAEMASKSFFDVILGSLEGMMAKLVEVLKKVPGIGPFIEEIEGIIAVFGEAKEEADKLADEFIEMGKDAAGVGKKIASAFRTISEEVALTWNYLAGFAKKKEAEMLSDWNTFLQGQLGFSFKTYQELMDYMAGFTDEQKDELNEQFNNWTSTYGEITKEIEDWYREVAGFTGDFADLTEEQLGEIVRLWGEAAKKTTSVWGSVWEDIARAAFDSFTDIIRGVATMEEAFLDFAKTLQTVVSDALLNLAIQAAAMGDALGAVLLGLAALVVSVADKILKAIEDWFFAVEEIDPSELQIAWEEFGESLTAMFEEIGMAMHNTMAGAERDLARLIERQADLQTNTRDKLIRELDNYYDYRELREMTLTELIELAAETREKIELGTIEVVEESEKEAAERAKDAKIAALEAIIDAHNKEQELINKKIALIKVEIKMLEYKMYMEQRAMLAVIGNEKERLRLLRLALEAKNEAMKALEELEEQWEDTGEATEDATKEAEDYGIQGEAAARRTKEGLKGVIDELKITRDKTDEARRGIEEWGEEIGKIPRLIEFDIVGDLYIPDIPDISPRYFDIIGKYKAPKIPSYQLGIPYVPETGLGFLHKGERVTPAGQNRLAGAPSRAGGGTQVTYERGAIKMIVMGGINQQVDLEKAMDYLVQKQAEDMARLN